MPRGFMSDDGWWGLEPFLEVLARVASARDEQKRHLSSSRYWSQDSHFLGLCGETVFSLLTGRRVDTKLRRKGDAGVDFLLDGGMTCNVKSATFWEDPHLKHAPYERRAQCYVLVGLDTKAWRGKAFGWATDADVQSARQNDYRYGKMRSLFPSELRPGLPPGSVLIPPRMVEVPG